MKAGILLTMVSKVRMHQHPEASRVVLQCIQPRRADQTTVYFWILICNENNVTKKGPILENGWFFQCIRVLEWNILFLTTIITKMNNRYPERCVFRRLFVNSGNTLVGNIPYHATKEDVLPILQSIGTVINLEYPLLVS